MKLRTLFLLSSLGSTADMLGLCLLFSLHNPIQSGIRNHELNVGSAAPTLSSWFRIPLCVELNVGAADRSGRAV
jgi:hypothetical protein